MEGYKYISFRFENPWHLQTNLEEIVDKGWNNASYNDLSTKLKNCLKHIDAWGKQIRKQFTSQIDNCRKEMEILRQTNDEFSAAKYAFIAENLNNLLVQGESSLEATSKSPLVQGGCYDIN
ncbi:hypothetical protein VNO78_15455 [Psophocarpus tetragonolobus]|uniref:Uncharacterized protein n=1 Tax=Psophocarpus tetragonolobus TaxID=3891 RepID=A0AAN9SE50_PSOTE